MGQCLSGNQAAAGNNPPHFSLRTLRRATNNFSFNEQISEGDSAIVYKGQIDSQVVAVKRLKPSKHRNTYYDHEVGVLSRLNHTNIIRLIGCCSHGVERIIIYEFMPFGSLNHKLCCKSWDKRMKIAAGVARGLNYIHNEVEPPVVFRGLKLAHVLLLTEDHPKISDFGIALSEPPPGDSPIVITNVLNGTHPFSAPESALADRLSSKSDVYSFGVLLLEIITGYVPRDKRYPHYVCNEVKNLANLVELVDPELKEIKDGDLEKALSLALDCIQFHPNLRPHMRDVMSQMDNLAGVKAKGELVVT